MELKPGNILAKGFMHWKHHMAAARAGPRFRDVLLSMCRTGHYYPGAAWMDAKKGMEEEHVDSVWKLMTAQNTQGIQMEDVIEAFYTSALVLDTDVDQNLP